MDDLFYEAEEGVRPVFSLLGMPVTAYALCVAGALALGMLLLGWTCRRQGLGGDTAWRLSLAGLPLGLLGARLFYCLARISFFAAIGLENILYLWQGGYALWGAVGGAALAAVWTARLSRQPLAKLLDALAAPGALIIALCRFAEYFSGEGRGPVMESEAFSFFPLAVFNPEYEEWELAVFLMEGIAALAILFVVLGKQRKSGDTARLMLVLYAACQVVLESLRRDDCLRWMFVRVSQLTAVILLALMMLFALIRRAREGRLIPKRAALWCAVFLLCVGLCIWMEFAQDKSPDLPMWACYLIMAAACAGLGLSAYRVVFAWDRAGENGD